MLLFLSFSVVGEERNSKLDYLSFITGSWQQVNKNTSIEVVWSQQTGNSVVGSWRKVIDGKPHRLRDVNHD